MEGDLHTQWSFLSREREFPLVIARSGSIISLENYLGENRDSIEANLARYGAILFRDFGIDTVELFNSFTKCFDQNPISYMFRSSPRHSLLEKVYISTQYPQSRSIHMHSESSYSFEWGKKIIFCCITPAKEGGATPIADNRRVLSNLGPQLAEKFETKGILYERNLSTEIGMPWEEVFQTEDQHEVIKFCEKHDIQYKFLPSNNLRIRWRRPAVRVHPVSKEKIWFNHSFFFNKFSLLEAMQLEYDDNSVNEYLPSNTFFGDGSEISLDEFLTVRQAYENEKVFFDWQKGDVLLLDNMLSAHGRSSYKGERQVVVSMLEPVR